ncbi:MAG: hypothetical protein EBU90_06480 [Proteobacteria bacterium]|nr:hypothetical protein [Pseudomonadota bacterium]
MDSNNNILTLIKFVIDNQGASEALRVVADFNNSIKGLGKAFDELDKKGLTSFDKLISTINSSKTKDATQQLIDLKNALGGVFSVSGSVSGMGSNPVNVAGLTEKDIYGPGGNVQLVYVVNDPLKVTGMGGGGGGGTTGGTDGTGTGGGAPTFLGGLKSFAGRVSPYLVYGAAASAAFTAADLISTGQISQSQAAQIQSYNLRIPLESSRGDVTLGTLKALGIGLAEQAERGGPSTMASAYATTGLSNLFSGLGNMITGSFSEGAKQISSVFNSDLIKAQYIQAKRDADKELYGPQLGLISEYASPVYSSFLNTYRMYGQRGATSLLAPLLSSGKFTMEDLERAQSFGLSAGIGMENVPKYAIGTGRRFLYSQAAEKAALVYGYKDREGYSSVEAFNTLLEKMGVKTATAETPIFSEALAQSVLSGSYNRYATMEGGASPLIEASKMIYKGNLSPEDQVKNLMNLARTFRGEEGKVDAKYLAFSRTLVSLGITNPADISDLYRMQLTGQGGKMLDMINEISGKKLSVEEFSQKLGLNIDPFTKFAAGLRSPKMREALEKVGKAVVPGLGVIDVEGKPTSEDISFAIARSGLPLPKEPQKYTKEELYGLLDERFPQYSTGESRFQETQKNLQDRQAIETAKGAGAAISADQELTDMGAGMINVVATGLEQIAKQIRNYPKDYRTQKEIKEVREANDRKFLEETGRTRVSDTNFGNK